METDDELRLFCFMLSQGELDDFCFFYSNLFYSNLHLNFSENLYTSAYLESRINTIYSYFDNLNEAQYSTDWI